jgi:tetratricopeptide (TPR) repeat protein
MGKITWTIILIFSSLAALCQQEKPLLLKGNELYRKQQYKQAAEEYEKAAEMNEKNPKASYNLGNALYKTKNAEGAEKAFDDAATNAPNETEKSKAIYNKGVVFTRQQKLNESIDAYKEALRLNPGDEEARQNLQKALNELKKQNQQKQPKQKDNKQNQNKQQKQKQQDEQQNKSKLNQKQVEQMLNALRQDEKKLQQDLQKKNNTGGTNSKDW